MIAPAVPHELRDGMREGLSLLRDSIANFSTATKATATSSRWKSHADSPHMLRMAEMYDEWDKCLGIIIEALLTRTEAGAVDCACIYYGLGKAPYICSKHRKDAAPVADGIDPSELSSLRQRAGAWDAVAETCRAIDPDALAVYGPTGRESIVNFIKQFTHPQDASASGLKTALWLLRGCVEHMEHSTEQGRAAWENARDHLAALQQTKGAGDV